MISLAIIGKNIQYSKYKEVYEELLNEKIDYNVFDTQYRSTFPSFSELKKFKGISIMAPFKQIYPGIFINCLKIKNSHYLFGNTEELALEQELEKLKFNYFLILGDGAVGKIAKEVINKRKGKFKIFSRSDKNLDQNIDLANEENAIILNCCSKDFIFKGRLHKSTTFYDLNWDMTHKEHILSFGGKYIDGLNLLKKQSELSLKFWNLKK